MASATRSGSATSRTAGRPCATAQYEQARVHTSPRIMNVAVPWCQHSPMFGHCASSHTVWRCSSRSPARLGDEISIGVAVADVTERRVTFAFDVRERGTDRLVCEASYRVACVDAASFTARAFPPELVSLLRPAIHETP